MRLVRLSLSLAAIVTLAVSVVLGAQIQPAQVGQPRDTPPPPTERRFPVGTASISGVVVTADTGRPVRGARVMVSGQATITAVPAASAPGRGRGPVQIQMSGGVPGGMPVGSSSGLSRTVMTDAGGEFSFPRMPAGQFTISVYQSQFLNVSYGQRRPGGQGTIIQLAEGQPMKLKVPMMRGGVVSGTVIGPDGEPQRNAQVRASRFDTSNGFKRLLQTGYAQSDDRGMYRMFGLQPGDYVISAIPNNSDAMMADRMAAQMELTERAIVSGQVIPPAAPGLPATVAVPIPPQPANGDFGSSLQYLPTYAPSSMAPSGATKVTVEGNEERMGIDIHVQLAQSTNIQGVVSTPLEPGVMVQVSLISDDPTIDSPQTGSARTDASGKFTIRAVGPGKYTVFAATVAAPPPMTIINGQATSQPGPPPVLTDAQKMWGKAQITVAGQPTVDVNVTLQPARSISGIVVFDMERPPDLTRARVMVTLSPAPSPQSTYFGPQPQAQVSPDGRFTITGVVPGRWMVRASGVMKSAIIAGQDTLDFPLEFTGDRDVVDAVLTLTDKPSELTGTLTDTIGKPAVGYSIIVVSSDNRFWTPGSRRIVLTRPGPDGRFTFRSLPAGSYHLAAVVDLDSGAQYDPEFLRTVVQASVLVTLAEGGKIAQDLRVK